MGLEIKQGVKGYMSHVKEFGIYCGDKRGLMGRFKRGSDRV